MYLLWALTVLDLEPSGPKRSQEFSIYFIHFSSRDGQWSGTGVWFPPLLTRTRWGDGHGWQTRPGQTRTDQDRLGQTRDLAYHDTWPTWSLQAGVRGVSQFVRCFLYLSLFLGVLGFLCCLCQFGHPLDWKGIFCGSSGTPEVGQVIFL